MDGEREQYLPVPLVVCGLCFVLYLVTLFIALLLLTVDLFPSLLSNIVLCVGIVVGLYCAAICSGGWFELWYD